MPRRSPTPVPISNVRTQLSPLRAAPGPADTPAQALDLCTHVGQTHSRWSCPPRRWPTPVPISNVRTQLSPLRASAAPDCPPLSYAVMPQAHQVEGATASGISRSRDVTVKPQRLSAGVNNQISANRRPMTDRRDPARPWDRGT